MQFKRSLGTLSLLLAAVGGIVGSGWLLGPLYVAKFAGPAATLSWILGGFLMMIIALTFAELASAFPLTGGTVRFLQLSHGQLVSFSMAWIGWLASVAVAPIETMALLHYADSYLPWLMHTSGGTPLLTHSGLVVAAALLLLLCVINSIGVQLLARANSFIVILKLLVPIATAIIISHSSFHIENFTSHGFLPSGFKGVLAALPSAGVIFSFIGYSPAIQLAGEAKNPQKSIPIAIIGGLSLCIVLYVLLQFSFIGALAPSSFAAGWSQVHFPGDVGPFAGLALALGLSLLAKVLFVDAAVSPYGTALIYTASAARMCYAMGKNGFLPQSLLTLNRFGIPSRIIVLNYLIGLLLFLPFPTWQNMMSFLVSSLVLAYAVGPLALIALRKALPDHPRPFLLPMPRCISLIAFYICNLIIFWTGWAVISKMLIAIAVGYLLLFAVDKSKHGHSLHLSWGQNWWMFLYIGLLSLTTYLGSFNGGIDVLHFGWDFLAVFVMSTLIFLLSQRYTQDTDTVKTLIGELE